MLIQAFTALRAGRLSSVRLFSHVKPPKRNTLPDQEHPLKDSEPTGTAAETRPTPNADQPKFITLKDALHPKTLSALTADPFNLVHMSVVQAAVLPLLRPSLAARASYSRSLDNQSLAYPTGIRVPISRSVYIAINPN